MLRWKVKPNPWFQELMQWALYQTILDCRRPRYLCSAQIHRDLTLSHMDDGEVDIMCTALLRASKAGACFRPTTYQFLVLSRVLDRAINWSNGIVGSATDSIIDRYFPDSLPMTDAGRRPVVGDFSLMLGDEPPLNVSLPDEERRTCLFVDPNNDEDDIPY